MLQRQQELRVELGSLSSDDADLESADLDRTIYNMVATFRLGFSQESVFDTLPVYKVCFALRRHPKTGIFHASNILKLSIDIAETGNAAARSVEVNVEMIGGNFPEDKVSGQECCLRLRYWTREATPVFLSSVFWPNSGCMVDQNGTPLTIENSDYLDDPRRDTTLTDNGVRIEEVQLPDELERAWAEGTLFPGDVHQAWADSCSSFELSAGSSPPVFASSDFSLADDDAHEPLGRVVGSTIRKWSGARHAGPVLPNVARHLILAFLFFAPEPCSFAGKLAVAIGVKRARKKRKRRRRSSYRLWWACCILAGL